MVLQRIARKVLMNVVKEDIKKAAGRVIQPQAAYSAYKFGFKHKFTFFRNSTRHSRLITSD